MNSNLNFYRIQKDAIKSILNLHEPIDYSLSKPSWKVLIYDTFGQNIISPLFTISELRECGVTLHLSLNSNRELIAESTAVYFILPSESNLNILFEDFKQNLYSKYYICFITPISRVSLETIAFKSIEYKCHDKIVKIYDEYLNYISLYDDLFISTIDHSNRISFDKFNSAAASEHDIAQSVTDVVESLFSLLISCGRVPTIKFNSGGPSDYIAKQLDKKIRNYLVETKGAGFSRFSSSNPILLIVDRTIDLNAPLLHCWSYLTLIDDLFTVKLNRITCPNDNRIDSYDFNSHDTFFHAQKFKSFPEVAENIQIEVENYKKSESQIKKINLNPDSEIIDDAWLPDTHSITNAIDSLPELMLRKKFLDMHTNIASNMMDRIKSGKLDSFFEIEQKITTNSLKDVEEVYELLNDESLNEYDRTRLLFIAFLSNKFDQNSIEQYKSKIPTQYHSAFDYLRQFKNMRKLTSQSTSTTNLASSYTSVLSKIVSKSPNALLQGIKDLVIKQNYYPITRMVKACLDQRYDELPDLVTLEPYSQQPQDAMDDIIVYIVGGGCYAEYQNIMSLLANKQYSEKRIIYGCTEMMTPCEFVDKLTNT